MHKSYQRWNPNNFFDPFPNFDDNVANDITDEWHSLNSAISIKLFTKCAISGDTLTMFIVECWFPIAIVFCEITNKSLIRFSLLLSGCPYDPEREDDQALPLDEGSFLLFFFYGEFRKFYAASSPPSARDWFMRVKNPERVIHRARNQHLLLCELLSCKLVLVGCYL